MLISAQLRQQDFSWEHQTLLKAVILSQLSRNRMLSITYKMKMLLPTWRTFFF